MREYWVINAKTLLTTVHRRPAGSEYARKEELTAEERLAPEAAPGLAPQLAVRLTDLGLTSAT